MKKTFIGFYDKNGKPLHVGDIVIGYQGTNDSYIRKGRPKEVLCVYEIYQSERSLEIDIYKVGIKAEHKEWYENYNYRYLPRFESKPKSLFCKKEDGTITNQWHYEHIKHLPSKIRYKCIPEVELLPTDLKWVKDT